MNILNPLILPIFGIILLLAESCSNKPSESNAGGPFPIRLTYDTINIIDSKGRKQGVWFVFKDTLTKSEVFDTIVYKNDKPYPVTSSNIKEVIDKLNKENN